MKRVDAVIYLFLLLFGEGGILSFFNLWFCTICIFRFQLHFLDMFFYRINIASNPSDFEDLNHYLSYVLSIQKSEIQNCIVES